MEEENFDKSNKLSGVDKPRSVTGAIFLIILGVIFLLNNLGYLSWTVWSALWRLWPVLLIFAGLEAIFKGSRLSEWVIFILGIVVFAVIAIAAINLSDGNMMQEMRGRFNWWPMMDFQ